MRRIGVQISLDDFGTGYSSLTYLQKLPITTLKIDKAFIQEIGVYSEHNTEFLLESIISLAGRMSFRVVAEGVETEEQLQFLMEKGCIYYQGFLLNRPLRELDALAVFLKQAESRGDSL